EHFRSSFQEGTTYTEKSKVEVICRDDSVDAIVSALMSAAHTGHPGDGIIIVSDVERVVKVRTGEEGPLALV
ncbi:MAG: P-II family nitrogen regulator, partial [Gammaproteobacteria bacterium]|nr:P-II family nitrogen regulator [Gemmatimonadota bacterium]NIT86446.1 P-II family nitrogen regulator [Gemmatimonadota bacterium]NIU72124.1 P-II family nitrogen regulator [Gammaproteobacteria bacterium]NIY06846.1 P-II family nitrogen regulator [Gemmatimonadota bacterium]